MDKSALHSAKAAQDELDGEEEVGVVVEEQEVHIAEGGFPTPTDDDEFVDANHTASNSFEMDDDELLTSDLDAEEPVVKTTNYAKNNDRIDINEQESAAVVHAHDDDDFSDEDLLAD